MRKKTLHLHLGMDKTGTSALQSFLYTNRDVLIQQKGLCYPETGLWHDRSHHEFAFSVAKLYGYSEDNLHSLFRLLHRETGNAENVIISSECLFKTPLRDNFTTFYDLVHSVFDKVRVIVYVRRQDEWIESRHKHSIISNAELSLDILQRPQFCDYKQFIDRWADQIGKENVTVRAYEKQQFTGGNIFSDFLSLFSLSMDERYRLPTENLNVSLGRDETYFKKLCNDIGFVSAGIHGLNQTLVEHTKIALLASNNDTLMSPAERTDLVRKYSVVNAAIATEYMGRESGVLFLDPLPDTGESWEPYGGLSVEALSDLWRFIGKHYPETINLLEGEISSALTSGDEVKVSAARTLRYALLPVA